MNAQIKVWKRIEDALGEDVANKIAAYNILLLCVSGFSNETIAKYYKVDLRLVDFLIEKYLGFEGLKDDLTYSPYYKYKTGVLTKEKDCVIINYNTLVKFSSIKKELDIFYEGSNNEGNKTT